MKATDYYAALGVPRDADLEHIKKAYRKLARQYHPDVSKAPDAEARFKDAALAYATLKNPEKRAEYDQIAQQFEAAAARRASWAQPSDQQTERENQHVFNDLDLESLLASMGRSHAQERRGPIPMPGHDLETSAQITLLQAHLGTTLHLQLSDADANHTLEISVPAGMKDDQKLRLRGKGGKGRNGGKDGDLYLHITLAPHALFRVDQYDLVFTLVLTPWEAALGTTVEVPTLEGSVQLTVAPGTSSGRKLRLRGQGLNHARSTSTTPNRGDLYALVQINVPGTLTQRERELFEELASTSGFKPRATAVKENTA